MVCQHCGADMTDYNPCRFCGMSPVPQQPMDTGQPVEEGGEGNDLDYAPLTPYRFKLNFSKLFGDAFTLYRQHFGTMCLVGLVVWGIPMFFYIGAILSHHTAALAEMAEFDAGIVTLIMALGYFLHILQTLAQWYLMLGIIRQSLYIARGGTGLQTNLMFPPFIPFLKMIWLMIVVGCLLIVLVLATAIPMLGLAFAVEQGGLFGGEPFWIFILAPIWLFPSICVVLWLGTRWYLAPFLLADQNLRVIDSMNTAWRASLGSFWMLLLATCIMGMMSFLGFLVFYVGIIMTIAFSWLGGALAYLQLTGQPNCLDFVGEETVTE